MTHNLAECADIVAGLANRRESVWRDRLKRPISYDKAKLREIAIRASGVAQLGLDAVINVIQSGIEAHEAEWQMEWALRRNPAKGRA